MFRFIDTLLFTFERLRQHGVLVIWTLIGLATAATLALSVMLYIDAVNTGLLESRLSNPPYAFRFRYLGAWEGNITQADVTSATAVIDRAFADTIGLPVARSVTYARGPAWTLRLPDNQNLGAMNIGTLHGTESQMLVTSGQWPPEAATSADDPIRVMVSEKMLFNMGIEVGDKLTAIMPGRDPVELQVTALWRPVDERDPTWIFPPKFFDEVLLVQEADLWRMLDSIERPVEESAWYLLFDGSEVRTSDVSGLLGSIVDGERTVITALPSTRMDVSPRDGLNAFNQDVSLLTQQLVIMVLPVGGLVLYFVALVAGLLVSRQQNEDVTLRSRGMSRRAILSIHFLMWLILAGIALAIGIALSPVVVRLVGQTTSFMRFNATTPPLQIMFTPQALAAGAITALIAASSGLLLAWRTTGSTITSYKQQVGRASRAWWQRMYLDVLVMIPALYVLYTLSRQGGLVASADDPFSDPLTFLGPTLFSLAFTLFFLRLWPILLRLLARVIAFGRGVTLLMALRELTRSIGRYRGTLLMMCFTLSLTGFTASMASTLDRSLEDSVNYRVGADLVIVTVTDAQTEQVESSDTSQQPTLSVVGYNAPPVEDLLKVPNIYEVSRVGRYSARLSIPGQRLDGVALGVDRATMAAVTRFRSDYAKDSISDLFNRLAGQRDGVLISTRTAVDYNLLIGQEVTLQINALGEWYETKVPIVGVLDFFPTLNPADGFFAVMNIDPIFELAGTPLPYNVWLSLKPGADVAAVKAAVREIGFPVLEWQDPATALAKAQASPSRRGVLGFLSVGFVASITLTLISAIIQSTASFRAQVTQLGSLRAMGLGGLSVAVYLIILQGMIAGSGILSGTSIGLATTVLFLPLLDFSGGLPPYLVRVAWNDIALVYAVFAAVLVIVTFFITLMLGRESLSTIVKLGDA
ncbi:MAG: ABC transporter permease [Anaerolineae bacterium]|nr:ABC transporter permease [Anaerolineae bacterium]